MKYSLILVCLTLKVFVSAQRATSTTKSISDDGTTLKSKYGVIGTGRSINYTNENVIGWGKEEKNQFVSGIVDSLENTSRSLNDYM